MDEVPVELHRIESQLFTRRSLVVGSVASHTSERGSQHVQVPIVGGHLHLLCHIYQPPAGQ
jgi:hypothetical protein